MKVVHICLCGPVSDNLNYQENMLAKYHVKLGHEVTLIAPQWAWGPQGKLINLQDTNYFNNDGVKVVRLPIHNQKGIMSKFKRYDQLMETLENEKPNVIFIHNVQFLDIVKIASYANQNPAVQIFIDNHADFSNSARNWLARHILYGLLWRWCARKIEPFSDKFYGVLPSRVDFIKNVYKIPAKKVELLVMGADDELVEQVKDRENKVRLDYGIEEDDFLIVTGGKIDLFKTQTLLLMEAVKNIKKKNVKLIVFGSVVPELQEKLTELCDGLKVHYIGWVDSNNSYNYFAAADLVAFPGRHSVFWEQVVGQGIPMICKYWNGTTHVDLGGNVKFLYEDSASEMQKVIEDIIQDPNLYQQMRSVALNKGMEVFSYKEIAKKSIGE
jgi:1,2-diacylglycerol 3-alpha-glucosyltransferase